MNPVRLVVGMVLIGLAVAAAAQSGGKGQREQLRPTDQVTAKEFDRMLEAARTGNGYVCNPFGDFSICSCTASALPGTPRSCAGMTDLCRRLNGRKTICTTVGDITTCGCSFPNELPPSPLM